MIATRNTARRGAPTLCGLFPAVRGVFSVPVFETPSAAQTTASFALHSRAAKMSPAPTLQALRNGTCDAFLSQTEGSAMAVATGSRAHSVMRHLKDVNMDSYDAGCIAMTLNECTTTAAVFVHGQHTASPWASVALRGGSGVVVLRDGAVVFSCSSRRPQQHHVALKQGDVTVVLGASTWASVQRLAAEDGSAVGEAVLDLASQCDSTESLAESIMALCDDDAKTTVLVAEVGTAACEGETIPPPTVEDAL